MRSNCRYLVAQVSSNHLECYYRAIYIAILSPQPQAPTLFIHGFMFMSSFLVL